MCHTESHCKGDVLLKTKQARGSIEISQLNKSATPKSSNQYRTMTWALNHEIDLKKLPIKTSQVTVQCYPIKTCHSKKDPTYASLCENGVKYRCHK